MIVRIEWDDMKTTVKNAQTNKVLAELPANTSETEVMDKLTPVTYKFYITDENRVSEILERVYFDVGKESVTHYEGTNQNFTVVNYEIEPDNGDEFIYGWEWLHEKFPECIKLITVSY